ncbi:MAG: substrate-binding periplasmic protein [Elainellaceae cyanobacterium]
MDVTTVKPGQLSIASSDFYARPMSYVEGDQRLGYEPDLARAVGDRLGLDPVWFNLRMEDFYLSLQTGHYDVIWFNQAITDERKAWAHFTRPYGLFDEAVLVKTGRSIHSVDNLAGLKVGGLADSTNIALAATFPGVTTVSYPGSDQVLPEMLAALRRGDIDALIDDELVLLVAADEDPDLEIAFSVPTRVPFGIAVRKEETQLHQALNETLDVLIADGTMMKLWNTWIPWKPFPF